MALKAKLLDTLKDGGIDSKGRRKAKRYSDGRYGLYMSVAGNSRTWVQRLHIDGIRRVAGLGPWPIVSLSEARETAFENVRLRHRGVNPFARKVTVAVPTFAQAADSYIKLKAVSWKATSRNEANWRSSLVHAKAIANERVDGIMTDDVAEIILGLIRSGMAPTAKAVRQRIRLVFDWCIAQGFRSDNPANGSIDAILPKANHRTAHHEAVEYRDVADVLAKVRLIDDPKWAGLTGAFQLAVMTACRTSEVLGATWNEIDLDAAVWTIPGSRMKSGRDHRVPLSDAALDVLTVSRKRSRTGLVFRSPTGKRIDGGGLRRVLKRIECSATFHGFRSSFRDWCSETGVDRAAAEWSLAHTFQSDTEKAYARSDLLELRRPVMQRWSDYLTGSK